ncbi:MAG TPA: amidohydrolase family protein [Acidimicrobiia bacterium]|nr:amidohydrolase family protein [Acidimicrobiia bacterium]
MNQRLLIRGGWILTMDPKFGNLTAGDVLVEAGRIAEIGTGLRARDALTIDATNSIVMPGFVDTHHHLAESLLSNAGEIPSEPPSGSYEPEDVYAATLIGLLAAAEAGITTVVDWLEASSPARAAAALEAHADSGLRTMVALVPPWVGPGDEESGLRQLTEMGRGPATTVAVALPESSTDEVEKVAAAARRLGLRLFAHAGTSTQVKEWSKSGLLGRDLTLIHCSNLRDHELDAIASSTTSVCLTPAAEMAAGLQPPIQKLIDRGIRPGLGVDRPGLAPGDLFAQMRAVISLQHAASFDKKLAGKAGLPKLLTTREVIRYATSDGAGAVGLGEVTGSIAPGKAADILVLAADRPNIHPVNDPIGAVVWGMDTSNVTWVVAGGQVLVADGRHQADVERARTLAFQSRQRLMNQQVGLAG